MPPPLQSYNPPQAAPPSPARRALLAATGAWLLTPRALAEPDEWGLGKAFGYPVGSALNWYQMPNRVGSWSAMDRVVGMTVRNVPRGAVVQPLPPADSPPAIRYRYRNLSYSVDEYLERRRITGLLVLKHGQIVAEHYRYGRKDDARFLSFSMAKSVTSLLVGIALANGQIQSLDDPAEQYARDLAGSPYGATPIRALLHMASGLTFTERYDGSDDMARLSRAQASGSPTLLAVLQSITDRHSPAGARFVYASAETEVLGLVLAAACGRSVAELTSEWLWQPLGAERDAFWVTSAQGLERVSGYFNASLRDWGRLGMLLANDGRAQGRQLVPLQYLLDATDAQRQPSAFRPRSATPFMGYGYQFWLLPLKSRSFALQGIHGQAVYVQPASGLVLVQTAVYAGASGTTEADAYQERGALWQGVLQSLGGQTD